jgi:hypothetical protein
MAAPVRIIIAIALAMSAVVGLPQLPAASPSRTADIPAVMDSGGQAHAGTQGLTPKGEKVEVPGSDGCFIYVTAWENGSWLDPNPPPGTRRLQEGTTTDTGDSKRDVAEIKRWLEQLLAQSEDMREKTRAACELSGVKFIQVAVVRDDPKTGPGTAFPGTPLILVDMGDAEKLAKSGKTSGTENPSLENSARMTLASYLPVTLIVHEIDHMRRTKKDYALFGPETIEGFAMDDENRVAVQLENFKPFKTDLGIFARRLERTSYTPVVYAYRPFLDIRIRVELDAAGAGLVFEQREGGQRPRFTELSDDDDGALGGVSAGQGAQEFDADLDGIGNVHDNCAHAWNPRQRDQNDDGTGDACDPDITQTWLLTQAYLGIVSDAVARAAATAGGPPQIALIGPDVAGGLRFVRLAEVWPFADPFGIFRTPGIGDRYLDTWLRMAVALRLATLQLFLEPLGVPPSAIVGPSLRDAYGSAPTDPRVQVFAARFGTFSPGSPLGNTIVIPVWVERPLASTARRPWTTARAPQPPRRVDPFRGFRTTGPGLWHAPPSQAPAGGPSPSGETPRPSLKVFFVSLGQTSGSAFKMTVVNDGNVPLWLMLNTVALKPLANVTAADVERHLAQFKGRGHVTMDIDGYCLEFPKQPPAAGMVFGLADDALQAAMAPIDRISQAVSRLQELGRLEPDTEDPAEYAHDMMQWSVWTHRERFDEPRFTRAFVEHVRKNFAAAGDRWTRDLEQTVTGLAPARWRVIQTILRESAALPRP